MVTSLLYMLSMVDFSCFETGVARVHVTSRLLSVEF
jgi:hypothetical protein